MIQYHVYPGGKKRIVTFSYDDGSESDARLADLFRRYGIKGTFHICSSVCAGKTAAEQEAFARRYAGQEISCHTVSHGWPGRMLPSSLVNEIVEDRRTLEQMAGVPVVGMSYPSGSYSHEAEQILHSCGIVYSRTTQDTGGFGLPENFLEWHPTCHHRDALPLCEQFMQMLDSEWRSPLLYIWGHSHELRTEEDWAYIERVIRTVAGSDKIWYATNLEIYEYMTAQRALLVSADERIFRNPTAMDVWVEKNKRQLICVPAGQTVVSDNGKE